MAETLSEVRWQSRLSGVVLIGGGIWLILTRRPPYEERQHRQWARRRLN